MFSLPSVFMQRQMAMKRIVLQSGLVGLSLGVILSFCLHQRTDAAERLLPTQRYPAVATEAEPKLASVYAKLPLSFEANQGQIDTRVRFLARGSGYTIFLTDDGAVLTMRKSALVHDALADAGNRLSSSAGSRWLPPRARMKQRATDLPPQPTSSTVGMRLVGTNGRVAVTGMDKLPGMSNYFIGSDPGKWRTNIANYGQVKFKGVYPGIDLVYYGNQRQLEYDFVVAPGADPAQIKLSFAGTDGMRVDTASGDLVLKVGDDEVRFRKPRVYQPTVAAASVSPYFGLDFHHSSLETVHSSFILARDNEVAFRVEGYDPERPLVIDPVLSYSTYLGGSNQDEGAGITIDATGSAYVIGITASSNFPTANPIQSQCASCSSASPAWDAFVAKLNPAGTALVYSTFLGGSGNDFGSGIAVDSAGNAYITGTTESPDFPTANAFEPTYSGLGDAFVAKLNPAGSALVYSTYLHLAQGQGIAVDAAGSAYVTGAATLDFPTANALQSTPGGGTDAFVAKLNPAGSALVYSTFLGGSDEDGGRGIALDAAGDVYVTGFTKSTDFPTAHPIQAASAGGTCGTAPQTYNCPDAFVAELNPAGSALVYSTYLGGSDQDFGNAIAIDNAGSTYVVGYTLSTDFPTASPLQSQCDNCGIVNGASNGDAFVAKLNSSALRWFTPLT